MAKKSKPQAKRSPVREDLTVICRNAAMSVQNIKETGARELMKKAQGK